MKWVTTKPSLGAGCSMNSLGMWDSSVGREVIALALVQGKGCVPYSCERRGTSDGPWQRSIDRPIGDREERATSGGRGAYAPAYIRVDRGGGAGCFGLLPQRCLGR